MNIRSKDNQAGFSLTEALVAFAVVTGGLLAVASFQAGLFSSSAYNKARTEALSLAQQKIEEFKSYADADEDNYVDENNDGVMDADGAYTDNTITGNNADFTRSWDITTTDEGKRVGVTVSWVDSANVTQSVSLASSISYLSPRSGADQVVDLKDPLVGSPAGRAERADGYLSDYPSNDISKVGTPGGDGLGTYRYQDDLFLVDPQNKVLLRLRDACLADSGYCTDFVRVSGTVYLDMQNLTDPVLQGAIDPETGLPVLNWEPLQATDILILPSDSGHCQRWVDSGSLSSPPTTANGEYQYFNYTCFFGGGWHGNIGFVTSRGLKQTDKVCQGDPISMNTWEQPVISLRRSYRGMLNQTSGAGVKYYSHGIADAATRRVTIAQEQTGR
jgi:Tfp pilus assembly protein PilV